MNKEATSIKILVRHVRELHGLTLLMDPGDTRTRIEGRLEEAKQALQAERKKHGC